MKLKQTKQVRLDELIKYIFDNEIKNEDFKGTINMTEVQADSAGNVSIYYAVKKTDTFEIEFEEEVNEHTEFKGMIVVRKGFGKYYNYHVCINTSIYKVKREFKDLIFIHLQNENGSIGELIWSKERGLVD